VKNSNYSLKRNAHDEPSNSPSIGELSSSIIFFRRFLMYSLLAPSFLATLEAGTFASFKHSSNAFRIFSSVYTVSIGMLILSFNLWFSYILVSFSIGYKTTERNLYILSSNNK